MEYTAIYNMKSSKFTRFDDEKIPSIIDVLTSDDYYVFKSFEATDLDEAQNCSKHAIKTIITRAGEGTKIILMGDTTQIDSPYLDEKSNGLSIVVEAFKDQNIAGHITLKKSERSKLAEIASEIL